MELRVFTEPQQGATYFDLLECAQEAERLNFNGFFRSDHFLHVGNVTGMPGPTDAWVTLGGLARETSRIRLGTLVTSATFRFPGPLAVSVAQVDHMSGGRIELGLGAGWYEAEHRSNGIAFPVLGERFDRLKEQLQILTGMWATLPGDEFNFDGRYYQISKSPGLPKPMQRPLPIIIGGKGLQRTPRLAALFASEFNMPFVDIPTFTSQAARVRRACEVIGRDPASMRYSAALVVCCGATVVDFHRRAKQIGRDPEDLRANGAAGLPRQVAETLRRWRDIGVERVYLQVFDVKDLDHLRVIAAEVAPLVA